MNIENLRNELIDTFEKLKNGEIKAKDAKELVNTSGKILISAKVQHDYNKYMRYTNKIEFLEVKGNSKKKLGRPKKVKVSTSQLP